MRQVYKGYVITQINLTTYDVWLEEGCIYYFTTNHWETAQMIIDKMTD